jgi:hypothetical protein
VKDWKRRTIAQANTMLVELRTPNGLTNTEHPVSQARGYMLDLVHQLQHHPDLLHKDGQHKGKLLMRWGWGAVLHRFARALPSSRAFKPAPRGLIETPALETLSCGACARRRIAV